MFTSKTPASFIGVCNVLDQLADPSIRTVKWRRPIYAAVDELRAMAAPPEQIESVERMSIALLKLDWAIQKEDGEKADQLREQLAVLGEAWRATGGTSPAADEEMVEPHEIGSVTQALERINQRHY